MPPFNLKSLRETSFLVHGLMILFGLRAWVDLAGIWVEMPILVERLPEGWELASYASVVLQVANIGLVVYTVVHIMAPKIITETRAIRGIYFLGGVCSLLLAFLWEQTTVIGGQLHSTILLIITFVMGAMDCSTSVIFVTFMANYKAPYLTSMFMGQGMGPLLVSLVALVQGVGNTYCQNVTKMEFIDPNNSEYNNLTLSSLEKVLLPPRFSPRDFFMIVFGLEVVSALAFLTLCLAPVCKREQRPDETVNTVNREANGNSKIGIVYITNNPKEIDDCDETDTKRDTPKDPETSEADIINNSPNYNPDSTLDGNIDDIVATENSDCVQRETKSATQTLVNMTRCEFALILFLAGWSNALWNGIGRTLQTYACLPFGSNTYHIAVTTAEAASPLACVFAIFVPTSSRRVLGAVSAFSTAIGAYVILTASLSPNPPMLGTVVGDVITILCQVTLAGCVAYIKVCVAGLCGGQSRRARIWFGVVSQSGALTGAIITFLLVTVYDVFQAAPLCAV